MCYEEGTNNYIYLFIPTFWVKIVNFYNTQVFHTNQSVVKNDIILLFYQMTIIVSIPIKVQSTMSYIFHHIRDVSPGWGYMLTAYVNSSVFMCYQQMEAGITHGSRHDTRPASEGEGG